MTKEISQENMPKPKKNFFDRYVMTPDARHRLLPIAAAIASFGLGSIFMNLSVTEGGPKNGITYVDFDPACGDVSGMGPENLKLNGHKLTVRNFNVSGNVEVELETEILPETELHDRANVGLLASPYVPVNVLTITCLVDALQPDASITAVPVSTSGS